MPLTHLAVSVHNPVSVLLPLIVTQCSRIWQMRRGLWWQGRACPRTLLPRAPIRACWQLHQHTHSFLLLPTLILLLLHLTPLLPMFPPPCFWAFVPSICFAWWLIAISERVESPWKNAAVSRHIKINEGRQLSEGRTPAMAVHLGGGGVGGRGRRKKGGCICIGQKSVCLCVCVYLKYPQHVYCLSYLKAFFLPARGSVSLQEEEQRIDRMRQGGRGGERRANATPGGWLNMEILIANWPLLIRAQKCIFCTYCGWDVSVSERVG